MLCSYTLSYLHKGIQCFIERAHSPVELSVLSRELPVFNTRLISRGRREGGREERREGEEREGGREGGGRWGGKEGGRGEGRRKGRRGEVGGGGEEGRWGGREGEWE